VDSNTAHILAGQRASLLRMVSDLDRVIEESSAWRALSVFETVALAAGGVESEAWKLRHQELQTALSDSPSFKLRLRLVAAIDALPADDQDFLDAISQRPNWGQTANADRRESIAQRIATLQPSPGIVQPKPVDEKETKLSPAPDRALASAAVQNVPRASGNAFDPVAAAARSIMDTLRVSVAIATQAEAASSTVLTAGHQANVQAVRRPDAVVSARPDLSTVALATSQISAASTAKSVAQETPEFDTYFDDAHFNTGLDHPSLMDEADIEEADVVVVQKKPLSTASLEQRLARMDQDAAGLVRSAAAPSRSAAAPSRSAAANGNVAAASGRATALLTPSATLETIPQDSALDSFDDGSSGFDVDGLEARVEIVKRSSATSLSDGRAPHPILSPKQHAGVETAAALEQRQRSTRYDYPAEPAAAFVAETVEASVEIVRAPQSNGTLSKSWRPTITRDTETVPVDRALKTLNGNLNGG
jgi:hypothetical protein